MRFSVCIPTTRATALKAAIDSICCQTYTDWELIVVGQGEEKKAEQVVTSLASQDARVRYIHIPQYGASRARNAGIQAALGEIIALIDDDCEARTDWLEVLAACFDEEPEVGLVGGSLLAPKRERRGFAVCPSWEPAETLYDPISSGREAPYKWDWVSANVAIRRSVIERAGLFDERLGPGTTFPVADDTDYKLRLEAIGIPMRATPRSVVYHTYGYRYGLRAVLRNMRNYARGNAGMAAKLTLSGDPRGQEWFDDTKYACTSAWFRNLVSGKLAIHLLRFWLYSRAYQQCLREYRVDQPGGMLYPIEQNLNTLREVQPSHL